MDTAIACRCLLAVISFMFVFVPGQTKAACDSDSAPIAFTALKSAAETLGSKIIKFENVILNQGNGYHKSTGKFVALDAGIYVFSCTLTTHQKVATKGEMFVNTKSVGKIFADARDATNIMDDAASITVTVALKTGDSVYVKGSYSGFVEGSGYSSFTGFRLGRIAN